MLGMRLAVMHNLYFYNELMSRIRDALDYGEFEKFYHRYATSLSERAE
jgi:queuine tRNA-ribosyltransferase